MIKRRFLVYERRVNVWVYEHDFCLSSRTLLLIMEWQQPAGANVIRINMSDFVLVLKIVPNLELGFDNAITLGLCLSVNII